MKSEKEDIMGKDGLMPIIEGFNEKEEFLYSDEYQFIKGYAVGRRLTNTLRALPLARQVHNGQYRKGETVIDGVSYRLPYVLHVLKVTNTLISISPPMPDDELDILLTCALLHDVIEDNDGYFKNEGLELVTEHGFPEIVYTVVRMLSKYHGATEAELNHYFNAIKRNKFALLVKMADRSHNVEDLYNMSVEKLHKYVKETRDYIYPLSTYAKAHYPELSNSVTILKSKIVSLTELTETLVNKYDAVLAEKDREIEKLRRNSAG